MPVVGLDLHIAASGNPFHPYIGLVIAPADYILFLGSSVHINGLKRGVSDTSGMLLTLKHFSKEGRVRALGILTHLTIGRLELRFLKPSRIIQTRQRCYLD